MIIEYLIGALFLGGVVAWLSEPWEKAAPRLIAVSVLVACGLAGILAAMGMTGEMAVPAPGANSTWWLISSHDWIPRFGISFIFGVDGLSAMMIGLTLFLGIVAVVSSWREIDYRPGFFHFNLLWTLAGVVGVFSALDLFLFFFFWEVMLIPMYLLIAIWGHEHKAFAAMKFFLFTQASGLLMLVAIVSLAFVHNDATGQWTFSYFELLGTPLSESVGWWLMLGFFIAFLVKLPGIPVHTWLPDAHTQAPTAASVLLAGILLKTGAYGLMRFTLPLFPEASMAIAEVAMVLGVVGVIYGAVLAFGQTDFKRLVAYSSISHMGFVLIGIYAFNELALQGSVMQMIAHGFSTAGLFMIAGAVQHRLHTRDMTALGGLWQAMPKMGAIAMFFIVASLGLPGLGNFVGEFLILMGAFATSSWIAAAAALGLITGAIYSLIAMHRVFHGPLERKEVIQDFGRPEVAVLGALMVGLVVLGMYPQPVLDTVGPALEGIHAIVAPGAIWLGDAQ